ncbi:hypothetical protein GCM10009105_25370 [Dokdonella soli]|uniref:JmjC domain-containing protein n=2 Tax=Dokdonella soli TaxID=529810 RepID=A0ABN1IPH0_9GAMM
MNASATGLIDFDWTTFDPWRIQTVRHQLSEHPLMQPDQLAALAERFEAGAPSQIFTFNNAATAGTNLDAAWRLHPNRKHAADTVQRIVDAKAWLDLRHVQADPVYRGLLDAILDTIKPHIERKDPGMYYRAGWIFVASPHTVTPFHIDRDHGILLQVRGCKTIYVWDADDAVVVSERARDRFHSRHELDLVQWHEEFRERAHAFHLRPGMGVYMPSTSPHMVETSDDASISMSCTYSTYATHRNALLHVMHDVVRDVGIEPPAVGRHPLLDTMTYPCARALVGARRFGPRADVCPSHTRFSPYAVAD